MGVRDSGLETLELGLCGFLPLAGGTISLAGTEIGGKGPSFFRESGGAYLSADRSSVVLSPQLRLRDNIIIHAHRRARLGFAGRFGIMDKGYIARWIKQVLEAADIDRSPMLRADTLSGGMLQRMVLAREFFEDPRFMVLSDPGWGLDQQGLNRLQAEIAKALEAGKGFLIFATEPDKLITVADDIFVLRNGEVALHLRHVKTDENAKARINQAMVGDAA
jgi:simple sugar transport system ATP-binding protein